MMNKTNFLPLGSQNIFNTMFYIFKHSLCQARYKAVNRLSYILSHALIYVLIWLLAGMYAGYNWEFNAAFAQKKSVKSSEKKGGLSKKYHSFVSYFNGYYNANVIYKEGIYKIEKTPKIPEDDFLPLITLGGTGGGQFDKTIEKCDLVIFKHKKGNWTDDCYFLKGRSEYYKGKYFEAVIAFEYVLNQYPKTNLKNKIYYWLAQTNFITNNKYRAKEYLSKLTDPKAPVSNTKSKDKSKNTGEPEKIDSKLKVKIAALQATMAIEEKDYENAVLYLETALPFVKKKINKAKWNYLIAQLYEAQKNVEKSKYYYNQTIALNANNDLNFRSKLNIIQLYIDNNPKGSHDLDEVTSPLHKLAAEEKYKEYRDQIYFKLAKLAQKQNNDDKALGFYIKSLKANSARQQLKSMAYFEVGKLYFYKKQNLDSSQAYFDSAATSIDPKSKDYYDVTTLSKTLKKYKIYKYTIREQDSILAIAALPEAEQKKRVAEYVDKEEEWKEKAKKDAEMKANASRGAYQMELFNQSQNSGNLSGAGGFYFDNPTQIQQGKAMFTKLWGSRKNEDDWRRSVKDKAFANANEDDPTQNTIADDKNDPVNGVEARKKRYFERIPKTEEDKQNAAEKIKNSLFELASLFAQRLNIADSAVKYFNQFNKRYPDSDYIPKGHYLCFTMYSERKNFPKTTEYRKRILEDYPKTIYAKLINKEAIDTHDETAADFNTAYKSLLGLYNAGDYATVIQFANVLIESHIDNPEIAKVFYMKGASFGASKQEDSMKVVYKYLKKNFPDEEVTKVASRTLEILESQGKGKTDPSASNLGANNAQNNTISANDQQEAKLNDPNSPFKNFNPRNAGDPFYIILLIDLARIPKKDLDVLINDFNKKNYSANSLQATTFLYTDHEKKQRHLVNIRQFDSGYISNAYLTTLLAEANIAGLITQPQTDAIFISAANFREAYSNKRFHHYGLYFLAKKDELIKQ